MMFFLKKGGADQTKIGASSLSAGIHFVTLLAA
jgi:hypothetical protein